MLQSIFIRFVESINHHNHGLISELITDDHQMIDSQGNILSGNENVIRAWNEYFNLFPDYRIEITEVFNLENKVAAFGFAGEFYNEPDPGEKSEWKIPAAWIAEIADGKITTWQVIADTKIPYDILSLRTLSLPTDQGLKRVTSVGGIFFKCQDPVQLKDWYKTHLGLNTDDYGTCFEWRLPDDPSKKGFLQWSLFDKDTTYLDPSPKDFMINYRVRNLELLLEQLKNEDVVILDQIESYDYGKFVHILDPEGNKIELWEPVDEEFDKIAMGRTK